MVTMRLSTISASAVAATVMGFLAAAPVQALPVDFDVSGPFNGRNATGYASAKAAEAAFLAGKSGVITETFESYGPVPLKVGSASVPALNPFQTSVGKFTQITATPSPSNVAIDGGDGLYVLSGTTSPFSGRRDMTADLWVDEDDSTGQWLDSNDSLSVGWTLDLVTAVRAIGFFLTDVSDVQAKVTATFTDGTTSQTETISNPNLASGQVVYVTALFTQAVSSITFEVNKNSDGWGIDNISVVPVPLPVGAWFMLTAVAGFVGYGKMRRKVATA